jgi:hypothetical protein
MINIKLTGQAADNALLALFTHAPWYSKPSIQDEIDHMTPLGITVSVKRNKPKHTNEQQGYYWLCLNIFAKFYGAGPDEMHNVILSEAFGSNMIQTPSGEHYKMPKQRSSMLNVGDYSALIETLHRCAAFNGCSLPEAETVA